MVRRGQAAQAALRLGVPERVLDHTHTREECLPGALASGGELLGSFCSAIAGDPSFLCPTPLLSPDLLTLVVVESKRSLGAWLGNLPCWTVVFLWVPGSVFWLDDRR